LYEFHDLDWIIVLRRSDSAFDRLSQQYLDVIQGMVSENKALEMLDDALQTNFWKEIREIEGEDLEDVYEDRRMDCHEAEAYGSRYATDRSVLIRLASTMPAGSPERRTILSGLSRQAKKSDTKKVNVEALLKKHSLGAEDLADLFGFVMEFGTLLDESPKTIRNNFRQWWGMKELPYRWNIIPQNDLVNLVLFAKGMIPIALSSIERMKGSDKKAPKKASFDRQANLFAVAILSAAAAKSQQSKGSRQDRMERGKDMSEEDVHRAYDNGDLSREEYNNLLATAQTRYAPPPKNTPTIQTWSPKKNGYVAIPGTEAEKTEKEKHQAVEEFHWENYQWAKEELGQKADRKEWDNRGKGKRETNLRQSEAADQESDRINAEIDANFDNFAIIYSQAKKANPELSGKDLASKVKEMQGQRVKETVDRNSDWRKKRDEEAFSREEEYELATQVRRITKEETDAASWLEKAIGKVAPEWAQARVKKRVDTKVDKIKTESEGKAPRKYEDYAKDSKESGKTPMPKETWEARYLRASDRSSLIRLASSLPKGDAMRRSIIAGLSKSSSFIQSFQEADVMHRDLVR